MSGALAEIIRRLTTGQSYSKSNFFTFQVFNKYSKKLLPNFQKHYNIVSLRNYHGWQSKTSNFLRPKQSKLPPNHQTSRKASTKQILLKNLSIKEDIINPTLIDTNVQNNVLLYKNIKDWLVKGGNCLGIFAVVSLLAMSDNVYQSCIRNRISTGTNVVERLVYFALPAAAMIIGCLGGPMIAYTIWLLSSRLVKYLILHKGGEIVTIITHHPLKTSVEMTVPLSKVSCKFPRYETKSYAAFKVEGTRFYFLTDKTGKFINPGLYDATFGVKRWD